jgi:hypothetical protein
MKGESRPLSSRNPRKQALLLTIALLGLAIAGCSNTTPPARTLGSSGEATKSASIEASSSLATEAEARALLARFSQPEEEGDPGYPALGPDHNEIAGWTRTVVLAHTDYGRIVHSLAAYPSDVSSAALADFDRRIASKGATATFDAVLGAEGRLEQKVTPEDAGLNSVEPASTFMGVLFDREGRLAGTYPLKSVAVRDDVATVVYAGNGVPDIGIQLELVRAADGSLRICGVRNYERLRQALADTELADGLP